MIDISKEILYGICNERSLVSSVSAETIINDGFSYSKYGKCIDIRIK